MDYAEPTQMCKNENIYFNVSSMFECPLGSVGLLCARHGSPIFIVSRRVVRTHM